MIVLGVDGGDDATTFRLITTDGELRARVDGPAINCLRSVAGVDQIRAVLRDGIVASCNDAGIDVHGLDHVFLGFAAHGGPSGHVTDVDRIAAGILGHRRHTCDHDVVAGWAGSLGGADGIHVVAGTGSVTYGEHAGRGARVGGWGELFGDEGSAHWIAVRALGAFSRMCDGRLGRGPLVEVLGSHLGLATEPDIVDVVVHHWRADRARIAALTEQVAVAAGHGDAVSASILADAGVALVDQVEAVRLRLDWPAERDLPVSWCGPVFDCERVRRSFEISLATMPGRPDLRRPLFPAAIGAAINAARLAGEPLDRTARQRLHDATVGGT